MKQIRKLLFILFASSMIYSCGEAGYGFDVTADFPVTAPIEIPIPGVPDIVVEPSQNINPDLTVLDYSLGDVSAFGEALDDLENQTGLSEDAIQINGLSFEITGIEDGEDLDLDELSINIFLGTTIINIPLAQDKLANKSKTAITLTDQMGNDISGDLINQLRNTKTINTEIVVDIGEIATSSSERTIDFDFKLYFDVLLRVRDL